MGGSPTPRLPPVVEAPKEDDKEIKLSKERERLRLAGKANRSSTKLTGPSILEQNASLNVTKLGGS
jgi:hypothetical protein